MANGYLRAGRTIYLHPGHSLALHTLVSLTPTPPHHDYENIHLDESSLSGPIQVCGIVAVPLYLVSQNQTLMFDGRRAQICVNRKFPFLSGHICFNQ